MDGTQTPENSTPAWGDRRRWEERQAAHARMDRFVYGLWWGAVFGFVLGLLTSCRP